MFIQILCGKRFVAVCVTTALGHTTLVHAEVMTRYPHGTRDAWFADAGATGAIETITFMEHPDGLLTNQYETSHGLLVSGSSNVFIIDSDLSFPNDGRGMWTGFGDIVLDFDRPMTAIAADFPGTFFVEFYNEQGLIESSGFWSPGGRGNFTGFISTIPFSRVRLFDTDGVFAVDDIHFVAQTIPAPGAVAVLLAGAGLVRRKRRTTFPASLPSKGHDHDRT